MAALSTRLLLGALAGMAGTAAMTACMARLHPRLPPPERYPLPPREITGEVAGETGPSEVVSDLAVAAHFGFGALCGAVLAGANVPARLAPMATAGVGIWAGSYFGWVPAFGILEPASEHPVRRNALMAGVHLVWGAVTAMTLSELYLARRTIFAPGSAKDAA
jgi:hypothetical protein